MLLQNECVQQNAYFSDLGRPTVLDPKQRPLLPCLLHRPLECCVLCRPERASLHHLLDESSFSLLLIDQPAHSRERDAVLLLTLYNIILQLIRYVINLCYLCSINHSYSSLATKILGAVATLNTVAKLFYGN